MRSPTQAAWSAAGTCRRTTSSRGLGLAIETPLGPLVGDVRLRDIPTADRLDELTFELPLAGGDAPVGLLRVGALADLLDGTSRRRRPRRLRRRTCGTRCSTSACAATSPAASTPCSACPAPTARRAFAVVDYKTNWLGVDGGEITAWDYRPAALAAAMAARPLPAAGAVLRGRPAPLPALAAARLRPRRPPRRRAVPVPPRHGRADTPRVDGAPCGVFSWRPPARLVVAASDLLDRGSGPWLTPMPSLEIDAGDARLALRASGVLREFNVAGVLDAADVHVADAPRRPRRRDRRGRPAGGRPRRARPAARPRVRRPRRPCASGDDRARRARRPPRPALARRRRTGSDASRRARSSRVGASAPPEPRPLRLEGTRLYLDRYWRQECSIADGLSRSRRPHARGRRRRAGRAGLDRLFGGDGRRPAASWRPRPPCAPPSPSSPAGPAPARRRPSPGSSSSSTSRPTATGRPLPRVALAAPTGKAAARLEEAVHAEAADLDVPADDEAAAARRCRPSRSTACSAGAPAPAAASATTARTGCRSTS